MFSVWRQGRLWWIRWGDDKEVGKLWPRLLSGTRRRLMQRILSLFVLHNLPAPGQHSTTQHSTAQHSTAQHSTAHQYSTVHQHNSTQYNTTYRHQDWGTRSRDRGQPLISFFRMNRWTNEEMNRWRNEEMEIFKNLTGNMTLETFLLLG